MTPFRLPFPKGRAGRPVRGSMNGTEARYAKHLDRRKLLGEIAWYWFEEMKFRLADKTWYCPDFMVMHADGMLELHEVKGWMMDDAAVKLKVASALYWSFPVYVIREKPVGVFTLRRIGSE